MKILDVRYNARIENGGARSHYLLLEGLRDKGHEVELLCTEDYPGFETHIMRDYMSVPVLELRQRLVAREVRRQLEQQEYDYVYSHGRYAMPGTIQAANETGTKSIIHFKDYWFADVNGTFVGDDGVYYGKCTPGNIIKHSSPKRILWNLYKLRYLKSLPRHLNSADVKLATSNLVKQRLEESGIEGSKVIPDPIDIEEYRNADGSNFREKHGIEGNIVAFTGTLEKHKGTETLRKIIREFNGEDITFVLTGTGSEKDDMENEFQEYDNVCFLGWVEREELLDLYSAASIVIYPSVYPEGFGRVPLEAAAAGTPVIMSDRVAVTEYFERGKNCYTLSPGDIEEWTECIDKLLQEHSLRENIALEASSIANEFSKDKHVNDFLQMIN